MEVNASGPPFAARLDVPPIARYVIIGVLGGILLMAFIITATTIANAGDVGIDAAYYRNVGARFLADGTYYLPRQLAGPYSVNLMSDVLYPPSALLLFVPAAITPPVLWWIVPMVISVDALRAWRPRWWGIAAMLLLMLWPRAHAAFIYGNTDMWAMAGIAAGLRWGWPAVFLTLKPIFAPLSLIGVRRRSWWLAAGVVVVFVVLTLPLWEQYVAAMRNLGIGSDYSLGSLPLLLVPIAARLARSRQTTRDQGTKPMTVAGVHARPDEPA